MASLRETLKPIVVDQNVLESVEIHDYYHCPRLEKRVCEEKDKGQTDISNEDLGSEDFFLLNTLRPVSYE